MIISSFPFSYSHFTIIYGCYIKNHKIIENRIDIEKKEALDNKNLIHDRRIPENVDTIMNGKSTDI